MIEIVNHFKERIIKEYNFYREISELSKEGLNVSEEKINEKITDALDEILSLEIAVKILEEQKNKER